MIKIMLVIRFVYKTILRDLVANAIDNPDSEVDEFVMQMLDNLFGYGKK